MGKRSAISDMNIVMVAIPPNTTVPSSTFGASSSRCFLSILVLAICNIFNRQKALRSQI